MTERARNALVVSIADCVSYRAVRGKLSEDLLSRPSDAYPPPENSKTL
jgi:hypothetical protein